MLAGRSAGFLAIIFRIRSLNSLVMALLCARQRQAAFREGACSAGPYSELARKGGRPACQLVTRDAEAVNISAAGNGGIPRICSGDI